MPISSPWHIPVVLHHATSLRPLRILDIGVGMGAYGFMLRQYIDVTAERLKPETWKATIDGVEIFPEYENPVWHYAYNKIHMGDVRELLPSLGNYDLIIAADVLEHFPQDEAQALVRDFLKKAPVLIATTPSSDYPQGAWGGKGAERHHCTLESSDFEGLVCRRVTGATACYICASTPEARAAVQNANLSCPSVTVSPLRRLAARIKRKLG